jgi:hypothetical protein
LPAVITCPECGKKSLRRVRKDYQMPDGSIIENLERFQCSSCLANFFDDAAMQVLEEVEGKKKQRASQTAMKQQSKVRPALHSVR